MAGAVDCWMLRGGTFRTVDEVVIGYGEITGGKIRRKKQRAMFQESGKK